MVIMEIIHPRIRRAFRIDRRNLASGVNVIIFLRYRTFLYLFIRTTVIFREH